MTIYESTIMKPCIIGISGKTGAGKSTVAKVLASNLTATLISWDDFDELSLEPENYITWYQQGSDYKKFKRDALEDVLATLKKGEQITHPALNVKLMPTKYVVFDAPLGKLHEQTGKYIDICIHIEVPLDVSLCRRLLRDFSDNLTTKSDLLEEVSFYLNHSRPLFFDQDLRVNANLVLDGMLAPEIQLQQVKNFLNGTLCSMSSG